MAERKSSTNKSTSGATGRSKSAGASKTSSKSRSKKAAELEAKRIREEALLRSMKRRRVVSILLCAFGVLFTVLAVFKGNPEEGWGILHEVLCGLFGGVASFFVGPLMIYSAYVISKENTDATILGTVLKAVVFQLMLCAAVEIFSVGAAFRGEKLGEMIKGLYANGTSGLGGGFFALFIGEPLLCLGQFGAVVLILIIALVCIFMMTNLTIPDLVDKIRDLASQAGEAASDYRERRREEREITDEHYRQVQEERRAAQQEARERRRAEAQAAKEQRNREREQERIERLKNTLASVDKTEEPEPEAENPPAAPQKPAPVLSNEPAGSAVRTEPVRSEPENAQPAPLLNDSDAMYSELKKYMEKQHPIMREDKRDPLEDENAELVPIVDALRKFNEDHSRPARVSKIVDAPAADTTTSEALANREAAELAKTAEAALVTDIDEAELPFDIDDIIPEKPVVQQNELMFSRTNENSSREFTTVAPAPIIDAASNDKQLTLADVYSLPPVTLLNPVKQRVPQADIESEIRGTATKLVDTLKSFGVETVYTGAARGPSVTRYELQLAPGVKISKIQNLSEDIALHIGVSGVRIAPVPEKAAVGIEVPNSVRETVFFRELVDNTEFKKTFDKKLLSVLGKDISGATVTCNVSKMPHLLIAGTTGSGKSVCVNSIIMSILMKSTPKDVRLIMVDPKQVEFMMYNGIPHLLIPVVTDPKKAAGALAWAVTEMENRYTLFSENNVRNIDGYNAIADDPDSGMHHMPQIVIFIDELADLMMASPKDVEDSIVRLAQKARAAGMFLVIATQKPTVQVVTGLIKGNIPSRIALMVASQIDSRVILDGSGAEKLLGNGDMLYQPVGVPKPIRLQGCYVSDDEVERVVEFIKKAFTVEYDEGIMAEIERATEAATAADEKNAPAAEDDSEYDEKLEEAIELVVSVGSASTSALQRKLGLGFSRAGRIMDQLEKIGVVGPTQGSKPRQVLMTKQEWYERKLRQES